jgi:hypothetical protein
MGSHSWSRRSRRAQVVVLGTASGSGWTASAYGSSTILPRLCRCIRSR